LRLLPPGNGWRSADYRAEKLKSVCPKWAGSFVVSIEKQRMMTTEVDPDAQSNPSTGRGMNVKAE
jgi:hypothetical protein